ncbi:MAG: UDP-N-acetylmuramoyl-L-alanine--D-glutamate ligase [Planctomycetota bacterium]
MSGFYQDWPVTILGLGRFGGGAAAARFLAEQGARVTITDLKPASDLSDVLASLQDLPLTRLELGSHPSHVFTDCRMLVVNPAVPPGHPGVETARVRGADITTEIDLFLRHQCGQVIGVTGSNGKSTTAALIHHLLNAAGLPAWLGGNIGISLLPQLTQIDREHWVVLELSSFQLELLRPRKFRPAIALLTNFSPNHLDWHGTLAAYRLAKQSVFSAQTPADCSIVPDFASCAASPRDDWRIRGRRHEFGLEDSGLDGAFLENRMLILRTRQGRSEDCLPLPTPPQLPGDHNRCNLAAAACAAWLAGASPARFAAALNSWRPLPHRLQCVVERGGRQFWNDSIATTPESAIVALQHASGRAILLAGGYDKGQDLQPLAAAICQHARAVVLMGQTAPALLQHLQNPVNGSAPPARIAADFPTAFRLAVEMSRPGDMVLLSPGCASYGWFRDYRDRGDQFIRMAQEWSPSA